MMTRATLPFSRRLVLSQWLLSLFGVSGFDELAALLSDEELEGMDENNVHRFHGALAEGLPDQAKLPVQLLLEYDQNIVRHTRELNDGRLAQGEKPINWKYFQYLALLFTEVYLDRYFRNPDTMRRDLNAWVESWNRDRGEADRVAPLDEDVEAWPQLNKLSFWMATGSGKTLMMHAHILQFRHYIEWHGRAREFNRILLLTPNEGLSQQHLREFEAAGIDAEIFDRQGRGLFSGHAVEILEVTKLREEMGETTVAVDAFEENNLVLVDEGHRGASSGGDGTWMRFRNALCARGFSFEYSATFGQAVKGSPSLAESYARNILVDYSYRYFYRDGFGKDYQILNLDQVTQRDHLELYLVAGLLSFFQQLHLFSKGEDAFEPFRIEKPLWVFVGSRVTKGLSTKDASDIVEILRFLDRYVKDRAGSIERIDTVLNRGLVTAAGRDLFAGRFPHLTISGLSPTQIFEESLAMLFNAPAGGRLYVENLKGAEGEVALRVGANNASFGVVNVGDDSKLVKVCEKHGLSTGDQEFSGSLFHELDEVDSTVNLLIGSRKFTEGWSSWRVSTMGLMNVGRGEGAQIIQLFGRGVRLKGYDTSLKRSARTELPPGVEPPEHLRLLETLGIFGVRANYMARFRDFLEEEGLPTNENRVEFLLPVVRNLGKRKLKTIGLKRTINGIEIGSGDAFGRLGPAPSLRRPDPAADQTLEYLQKNQVVLNWYPKIQALRSDGLGGEAVEVTPTAAHLTRRHVAFLDLDGLYLELERFKTERGWYNLNIPRSSVRDLLLDPSWYHLRIPEEALRIGTYERVELWQELALALLKKYVERYFAYRKQEWELGHLEYRELDEHDPNFPSVKEAPADNYYRILLDRSQEEIIAKLEELKDLIERGELGPWRFRGMKAIRFSRHLYQPLLWVDPASKLVEIRPTPLNAGEFAFVEDLKRFHDAHSDFFDDVELYLMRNQSRGRGIGFFEAGNFHPDFILWLVVDGRQHIVFADPKGLRNVDPDDPKIRFYERIKKIQDRLNDPTVRLDSFIVSNTYSHDMGRRWGMEKDEMKRRNILFQEEDRDHYVREMLAGAGVRMP